MTDSTCDKSMNCSMETGDMTVALQQEVIDLTGPEGQWHLSPEGRGVERSFKFKTFKAAWAFMSGVAGEAQNQRHHPEWSNVYNTVFIRWTTHDVASLSAKDIMLAKKCDELAQRKESLAIGGAKLEPFKSASSELVDQATRNPK